MKNKRVLIAILAVLAVLLPTLIYTYMKNREVPLIKHIGINFTEYDPETKTFGDVPLTSEKLGEFNIPFFDYGFFVPANSVSPDKYNPQPTFIVPLGTKVRSLIDGEVVLVEKLYSNDYTVHVQNKKGSPYSFETEHIINVSVKVGDKVKAGDVVGEVSDYDAHNYSGYGLYEIGILIGGSPPKHICPFAYLDPSVKDDVQNALRSLYKEWNKSVGSEVYDVDMEIPGCITTEEIGEPVR